MDVVGTLLALTGIYLILVLLSLVLIIWAFINAIIRGKIAWAILIVLLPLLGAILYYFLGRKK